MKDNKGFICKSEKLAHGFKLYHVKHWDSNLLIYRYLIGQSHFQYRFDIISKSILSEAIVQDIAHAITNIYLEIFKFAPNIDIVNITTYPDKIASLDANGIIVLQDAWELFKDDYIKIYISGISPNDIPINFMFLVKEKIRMGILNKIL